MDEDKDGFRRGTPWRIASRFRALLLVLLSVHIATVYASGPRHFDLEAGDASLMLNEFSRQSDLQVLFDFNTLIGLKTRAVTGNFDSPIALKSMLKGTNLEFAFVNDHTLAVTPKKPSTLARLWHRLKPRSIHASGHADGLEQVLISGAGENGTQPLLGTQTIQFGRVEIERSGLATTEDFLRTLPQVFGGGPSQDTVLGREAGTNSASGNGVNIRGLNAGATLVLIDGKRIAPSGTAGAFEDISNIPLSIIDHVDILPDGASAKYGADALGGVVNFVTRSEFTGAQTQARGGGVTNGSMGERQFSQLFGNVRASGSDLLTFEYFQRDPLQAKDRWQYTSDLTPYGGTNFDTFYGNGPGTLLVGSQTYAIPKSANGATPTAAELVAGTANRYDTWEGSDATPGQERWSIFTRERQNLTDDMQLHFEGLFTRRKIVGTSAVSIPIGMTIIPSSLYYVNPTGGTGNVGLSAGSAPFFGPVVGDNRIDTGNFSLTLSMPPFDGWTANGTVAYTFENQHIIEHGMYDQNALEAALADRNPSTAFNPFGDASNNNPTTLASIGGDAFARYNSTLRTVAVTMTGPTIPLPGGDVDLSVGVEHRAQDFNSILLPPHEAAVTSGTLSRQITAGFAEVRVPIVGEANQLDFARRFELSLGARREHFSDVGGATIPKIGFFWSVNRDWNFRSSWTKSFKPPNLTDLTASGSQSTINHLIDPSSPTGLTPVLSLYGTNPALRPETARSFTFGTDFTLPSVPGFSLSLTYFNIVYANRITNANINPDVLIQPSEAWLLNRNVTAADLSYACQHTVFAGSQQDCLASGVGVILDNRLRNIALLKTNGLDLIGKYSFDSPAGKFEFGLNGTYILRYAQSNAPNDPPTNIVSTQNNPINLRARGSAAWTHLGFGAAGFVNFENHYRDTVSVPNRSVSPWTTIDLQLSYQMPTGALGWLANTQFALNVQNLFNVNPPFLNNQAVGLGYDQENADLYGRTASFEIRKRW